MLLLKQYEKSFYFTDSPSKLRKIKIGIERGIRVDELRRLFLNNKQAVAANITAAKSLHEYFLADIHYFFNKWIIFIQIRKMKPNWFNTYFFTQIHLGTSNASNNSKSGVIIAVLKLS